MFYWSKDSKQYLIDNDKIMLMGVPYEGTTTGKSGTKYAPQELRHKADFLESYSPYLNRDLRDLKICDLGDMELTHNDIYRVMEEIERYVYDHRDYRLVFIGGEHFISYPIVKVLKETKYPDLKVIQFDAHADLRTHYNGSPYSHSSVMHHISTLSKEKFIYQFGIRSGSKKEFTEDHNTYMQKFNLNNLIRTIRQIKHDPVYITLDLDVLDPIYFIGTGTIEPNGVSLNELFEAIYKLRHLDNVVGIDIVELAPILDPSDLSTITTLKILREFILSVFK